MFKRLFVLLVLVVALVAVSSPARAATLSIDRLVCIPSGSYAECSSSVSGGTGIYSYDWGPCCSTQESTLIYCAGTRQYYQDVTLTVTDSSGATASRSTRFRCSGYGAAMVMPQRSV